MCVGGKGGTNLYADGYDSYYSRLTYMSPSSTHPHHTSNSFLLSLPRTTIPYPQPPSHIPMQLLFLLPTPYTPFLPPPSPPEASSVWAEGVVLMTIKHTMVPGAPEGRGPGSSLKNIERPRGLSCRTEEEWPEVIEWGGRERNREGRRWKRKLA